MKKHIFLTRRDMPLPGWRAAFPDAAIRGYPAPEEAVAAQCSAIIWLHIDNHVKAPAALVGQIRKAAPGCTVIVLSNVPNDEEGLAVLEAGASGYTGALAVANVLRDIDTVVESGGLWVGPELLQRMLAALGRSRSGGEPAGANLDQLSEREREVALAVAAGASNKEIAFKLNITERTVKAHLHNIFETLKLRDRLQLAIYINGLPVSPQPATLH